MKLAKLHLAIAAASCTGLLLSQGSVANYTQSPTPAQGITKPASNSTDALDKIATKEEQQTMGWSRLSPQERDATATFVNSKAAARAALAGRIGSGTIADARDGTAFLKRQGWQKLQCEIVRVQGQAFFVVQTSWGGTEATDSVPFGLTAASLQASRTDGSFWCKEEPFGGISAVLVDGTEHSFTFASWKKLK